MAGAPPPVDQPSVFKDSRVITVAEAALILEDRVAFRRRREPDYVPNPLVLKTVAYAQRFADNRNKESLQKMRELLAAADMTEVEVGLVLSLLPRTADEAKALVPSLADERFGDEELDRLLAEVAFLDDAGR